MLSKLIKNRISLLVLPVAVLLLFACEDFQSEDFTPSETDETAISVFEDTNTVDITASTLEYDSTLNSYVVTHKGEKDTLSSFNNIFDILDEDTIKIDPGQTHYKVTIKKNLVNGIYLNSQSSSDIYLYTNEQIAMNLVDDNNQKLMAETEMPMELMAGHYAYNPEEDDYPQIIVKTRYSYSLSEGNYLLQIESTQQTAETTFSLIVISEQ